MSSFMCAQGYCQCTNFVFAPTNTASSSTSSSTSNGASTAKVPCDTCGHDRGFHISLTGRASLSAAQRQSLAMGVLPQGITHLLPSIPDDDVDSKELGGHEDSELADEEDTLAPQSLTESAFPMPLPPKPAKKNNNVPALLPMVDLTPEQKAFQRQRVFDILSGKVKGRMWWAEEPSSPSSLACLGAYADDLKAPMSADSMDETEESDHNPVKEEWRRTARRSRTPGPSKDRAAARKALAALLYSQVTPRSAGVAASVGTASTGAAGGRAGSKRKGKRPKLPRAKSAHQSSSSGPRSQRRAARRRRRKGGDAASSSGPSSRSRSKTKKGTRMVFPAHAPQAPAAAS